SPSPSSCSSSVSSRFITPASLTPKQKGNLGGYGILPYPRTPLMIAVVFLGGYGILPYPRTSLML
ncbi:hypothetical protein, partial [Leyella stercorea]|uniref:hypothetical protein n=1 Tax=Leyella stercorea TaxID=363265 RepID=UPI0024304491